MGQTVEGEKFGSGPRSRYMTQSVDYLRSVRIMKAIRLVSQLIAFYVAGTFARVYSDRIYFETDFTPDGSPSSTTPSWTYVPQEGHRPEGMGFVPSKVNHQQPLGSVISMIAGLEPVATKVDAPEKTTAVAETTTVTPYVPGILDQAVNMMTLNMETLLDTGADVLVFSPLSIVGALSIILLGAGGETMKELAAVLGVKAGVKYAPDGTDLIHEEMANYLGRFESSATGGLTRFANGVFLKEGTAVSDLYVKNVQRLYVSEVQFVNFKPQGMINSMKSINHWVSNRTDGHLKKILSEPLPADTIAVFINVIYFQGEWEHPFCTECVRQHKFYVTPEETVHVNMMSAVEPAYFDEDKTKGYKILGLPYRNSDLAMYFILPQAGPKKFLEGVKVDELTGMVQNATMRKEVIYIVPKMKLESTLDLVNPLRKMGLKSMFSPSADLQGVAEGIWINSVLQKVEIEINETGTTAAVSTMISATRSGHRPSIRLDQPFIFMVYHRTLRTIMFWGTVYKPTPNEKA